MSFCACCWPTHAKPAPVHVDKATQTPNRINWPTLPKSDSYSSFGSVEYECPERLVELLDATEKGVTGPIVQMLSTNTNTSSHECIVEYDETPFMSRGRLLVP